MPQPSQRLSPSHAMIGTAPQSVITQSHQPPKFDFSSPLLGPKDGLYWRRMSSPVGSVRKASGQVRFHLLEELIIFEQDIKLF